MNFLSRGMLLCGFVFVLLLSHCQTAFQLDLIRPLTGAFEQTTPTFHQNEFLSFQFQEQLEKETSRHWGLQPLWVRLIQQIRFDLFHLTNDKNIKGQNNVLFGKAETQVATGMRHTEADIAQSIQNLQRLHAFLKRHQIPLIVVLAPNKSRYFQHDLPSDTPPVRYMETPYESVRYHLLKAQIPFWDATKSFQTHMPGQPYLMPPLGIHWSLFGAQKSIATLLTQIQSSWHPKTLGTLEIGPCELSNQARFTDTDMLDALNLLFPPQTPPLCYPQTQWHTRTPQPKITAFGDSMYLTFIDAGLHRKLFSPESLFAFYNRSLLQEGVQERMPAHFMNLTDELLSSEVVLFMATEVNFHLMDFGVPQQFFKELDIRMQNGF